MSFRINTNIEAMVAQRNLSLTGSLFAREVERLSSGLRINRAGDDAAGLSISEKLNAQVRGLAQATRNAQDAISMIQTAEGALQEVHSMLQRMRELAVQASNDTLSAEDRAAINAELQQLKAEIDGISARTKFNGKSLLNGNLATTRDSATPGTLAASYNDIGTAPNTSDVAVAVDVSGAAPGKTYTLTNSGANLTLSDGAVTQTLTVTLGGNIAGTQTLNFDKLGVKLTLTTSDIQGTGATASDIATALNTATVITSAANASANFQIGADATDTMTVAFTEVKLTGATAGSAMASLDTALGSFNTDQSVANAQALVTAVDGAITYVSTARSNLGAAQNRLEHTIANLQVARDNVAASLSRVRDADIAEETVQYVRAQILQQAGTAILAQANQAPQLVLALLGGR